MQCGEPKAPEQSEKKWAKNRFRKPAAVLHPRSGGSWSRRRPACAQSWLPAWCFVGYRFWCWCGGGVGMQRQFHDPKRSMQTAMPRVTMVRSSLSATAKQLQRSDALAKSTAQPHFFMLYNLTNRSRARCRIIARLLIGLVAHRSMRLLEVLGNGSDHTDNNRCQKRESQKGGESCHTGSHAHEGTPFACFLHQRRC